MSGIRIISWLFHKYLKRRCDIRRSEVAVSIAAINPHCHVLVTDGCFYGDGGMFRVASLCFSMQNRSLISIDKQKEPTYTHPVGKQCLIKKARPRNDRTIEDAVFEHIL